LDILSWHYVGIKQSTLSIVGRLVVTHQGQRREEKRREEKRREEKRREEKRSRVGYGHVEREEKGGGRRKVRDESKRGKNLREQRGQAAPFIVGWATLLLPGNCGEEHTWLCQITVGVEPT
jgi:hypothetical protein